MRIAIGGDHAAYSLKQGLKRILEGEGHGVLDLGTFDPSEPDDYPDFAAAVGRAVVEGRAERGVLLCGSGVGASVAANKRPGIRAGVCHDAYSAHQGVEHDAMNVLVLGARVIGPGLAEELVRAFLGASYSGEERHERRLAKVRALECDPQALDGAPGDTPSVTRDSFHIRVLSSRETTPMDAGFDQPLYVLPFDHRGTFQTKMFEWTGELSPGQTAQICTLKEVIYDGFRAALEAGVPARKAGILVDEQFGAAVLRDAAARGYTTALTVEKSGRDEFDFEYGDDFAAHIEAFHPTFAKVLVRYNPEGDAEANARQTARLKRLSDHLHRRRSPGSGGDGTLFMLELVVPPLPDQLHRVRGDRRAYDLEVRPGLMVRSIGGLQQAGVEPDVWKIEGLDRREDCERVAAAARRGGRDRVGCIVLGRGEDDRKVRDWLATAAGVPGYVGFAVGRTTFWDALTDWRTGRSSREEAVAAIARRYREWVDIFEAAAASGPERVARADPVAL